MIRIILERTPLAFMLLAVFLFVAPSAAQTSPDKALQPARKNGKWGFVSAKGVFVIPPKYYAVQPFKEGLALVVTSKPWQPFGNEYGEFRLAQVTYIDTSGREIHSPISVRRAASFSDGRALVVPDSVMRMRGGCAKGGYLSADGSWAIKPQFDDLRDFSEGLAAVNIGAKCGMGGKWGYIEKSGRSVIPVRFRSAEPFRNGRACVLERSDWEAIDEHGNALSDAKCP
ncbi:MAG TPA: WG repeat-containing protein [Terriglobales bacterium]|nr:WG repeat-containing protein [Terriglobales bacterium]